MTIKVEREALLQVLERTPLHLPSTAPIPKEDDFLVLEYRPQLCANDDSMLKLRCPSSDDDDSVGTLSTASFSDSDSEIERRVSFAEDPVTAQWSRDYTAKEDIPNLFYSTEETQRFRQEYRMERKLLSELCIDPDTVLVDNDDFSALVSLCCSSTGGIGRHRISRVVVLHNDKLETFFNPGKEASDLSVPLKTVSAGDDFFDNDSFWSGSITWY